MTLDLTFNLILIAVAIGAQWFVRPRATGAATQASPFLAPARCLALIAIGTTFIFSGYYTALQYFTWASSSISRLLLPPHQSPSYFLYYAFTEFWGNQLLAICIGLFFFWIIRMQMRTRPFLFYPEEPWLCLLGFSLVGHPLWSGYAILLIASLVTLTAIKRYRAKSDERVSFRYLWLPVALIIVASSHLLNKLDFVIYGRF